MFIYVPKFIKAFMNFIRIVAATFGALRALKREAETNTDFSPWAIKRTWAHRMMQLAGFYNLKDHFSEPQSSYPKQCLYVGVHSSYLDIPMLMRVKDVSFVSKSALKHWPVFGKSATLAGTLYVKRNSSSSRLKVVKDIAHAIEHKGLSVALFPSGTTSLEPESKWQLAAFRIAKKNNIPVVPFRIRYSHPRRCAYIDTDFFPIHLLNLIFHGPQEATLEFGTPTIITDPETDANALRVWGNEIKT